MGERKAEHLNAQFSIAGFRVKVFLHFIFTKVTGSLSKRDNEEAAVHVRIPDIPFEKHVRVLHSHGLQLLHRVFVVVQLSHQFLPLRRALLPELVQLRLLHSDAKGKRNEKHQGVEK